MLREFCQNTKVKTAFKTVQPFRRLAFTDAHSETKIKKKLFFHNYIDKGP